MASREPSCCPNKQSPVEASVNQAWPRIDSPAVRDSSKCLVPVYKLPCKPLGYDSGCFEFTSLPVSPWNIFMLTRAHKNLEDCIPQFSTADPRVLTRGKTWSNSPLSCTLYLSQWCRLAEYSILDMLEAANGAVLAFPIRKYCAFARVKRYLRTVKVSRNLTAVSNIPGDKSGQAFHGHSPWHQDDSSTRGRMGSLSTRMTADITGLTSRVARGRSTELGSY